MREVVLVTQTIQRKEVVVDREPAFLLIRNVTVSMAGRVMDVNYRTVLEILTVVTKVKIY